MTGRDTFSKSDLHLRTADLDRQVRVGDGETFDAFGVGRGNFFATVEFEVEAQSSELEVKIRHSLGRTPVCVVQCIPDRYNSAATPTATEVVARTNGVADGEARWNEKEIVVYVSNERTTGRQKIRLLLV